MSAEKQKQKQSKRTGFITRLLIRLIINAGAIYVAAQFVPGIHIEGWKSLLVVALVFGVVNALIRPFVSCVTCLIQMVTMGLFTLVINAGMLYLTAWFAGRLGFNFTIDGLLSALLGALIISVVSFVLSKLLR